MRTILLLLLTASTALAGSGPLNLAKPQFQPNNIGNNLASYDAFYGATVSAGSITVFADLTGSGKTMTGAAAKPTQVSGQNGRFAARFTTSQFASGTAYLVGNNFDWFVTFKAAGPTDQAIIGNVPTNRQIFRVQANGVPTVHDGTSTVTGTAWNTSNLVFTGEMSCSAGTVLFRTNGVATGGVAGGTIASTLAANSIGNIVGTIFCTNDLYRIDGFSAQLQTTPRLLMENYHRTQWKVW